MEWREPGLTAAINKLRLAQPSLHFLPDLLVKKRKGKKEMLSRAWPKLIAALLLSSKTTSTSLHLLHPWREKLKVKMERKEMPVWLLKPELSSFLQTTQYIMEESLVGRRELL